MAKKIEKKSSKTQRSKIGSPFTIYWQTSNYYLLGIGIVLAIIGFILMSVNPWDSNYALVLSPIVLFLAYLIAFPLSMFFKKKEEDNQGSI